MNRQEILDKIQQLNVWKNGNIRAPHKPLLILYALGQLQANKSKLLPYKQVKDDLKSLLIEFGPDRKSYHPEHPFVRLQNDGIWNLNTRIINNKYTDGLLLNHGVEGGFSEEVYNLFKTDKFLVQEVAEFLLHEHFSETIHDDILNAVGLNLQYIKRKQRDPVFRHKILQAYEFSCAICGFNVRHGHNVVGIEAAHIKWHQAGGPDTQENGVALCTMHHKLFDKGVFTFSESKELLVSEKAYGTNGFDEWLMRFHGKRLREPVNPIYQPNDIYLQWHVKEVFKGPARYQTL